MLPNYCETLGQEEKMSLWEDRLPTFILIRSQPRLGERAIAIHPPSPDRRPATDRVDGLLTRSAISRKAGFFS